MSMRHLQESDAVGFDDTGSPVPVVWSAPEPLERSLMTALEDTGATFPDPGAALGAIASAFDMAGDVRAAETLAMVLARLPGGRRGQELRQALLGTLGDGTEAARENGVSKQSWFKGIQRLRQRIFKSANFQNG